MAVWCGLGLGFAAFCFAPPLYSYFFNLPNLGPNDRIAVVDVGGIVRFTLAQNDDQLQTLIRAFQAREVLADNVELIKTIGYDAVTEGGYKPLLALRENDSGTPTIFFNGMPLLAVNADTARIYGLAQDEVARRWMEDLKKVVDYLPYLEARHLKVLRTDDMLTQLSRSPRPAEITVGGRLVMRLHHEPKRLMDASYRAAVAFENIQKEINIALQDPKNYDPARVQVGQLYGETVIVAGSDTVCFVSQNDAYVNHSTPHGLAEFWAQNLRRGILRATQTS